MNTLPYFPHWLSAEQVLSYLADQLFAPSVRSEANTVHFQLLATEYLYLVPNEDFETFTRIYNVFASYIHQELGDALNSNLGSYMGSKLTPHMLQVIEVEMHNTIRVYESSLGMTLVELLKGCFGIMPYAFMLPTKLSNQVKIEMGR